MARFKKKSEKRDSPTISTASLPDIVFMLLFFFMVATVTKETDIIVSNKLPKASEVTKIQDKQVLSYIYVGKPLAHYQNKYGTETLIQLNDKFASLDDIAGFVENKRNALHESLKSQFKVSLKIDENTKSGIVNDIKQELRKAEALDIIMAAVPSSSK